MAGNMAQRAKREVPKEVYDLLKALECVCDNCPEQDCFLCPIYIITERIYDAIERITSSER